MDTEETKTILDYYQTLELESANEAETRLKLIDDVLFRILGWSYDDVKIEERVSEDNSTTWADYVIHTADVSIVIEAKKIGAHFKIPPQKRRIFLNSAFVKEEIGDAIKQARDYARKLSIPYAVVTNGKQWVIFPATRVDGVSFAKSEAIVFDSLESILDSEGAYFKSLLSRDGVLEDNLALELFGRKGDQFNSRRLRTFFDQNNNNRRNEIYPLIEEEINKSFIDLTDITEKSVIEKCYVNTPDRTKFDNTIKMHISKRCNVTADKPIRPMRRKEHNSVGELINTATKKTKPLAILVLGTVGAGKTTFLNYTRYVSCKSFFESEASIKPLWINIDFRNHEESGSISTFIYRSILDYINDNSYEFSFKKVIEPSYKSTIDSLKNGPLALIARDEEAINKEITNIIMEDFKAVNPYIDKILAYLSKQTPVFLIIDNVDQFPSDDKQSEIFAESMAIVHKLNINLFLCMRQSTFVKHKSTPIFDAFDYETIEIEPPIIRSVLSKRFHLAKQMLKGKPGAFTAKNGILFRAEDLSVFIDIVQNSVLGTKVIEHITNFATGDIRLALRMTRSFLERGYTDPAKALKRYEKEGRYRLPVQEALRSILLGKNKVYDQQLCVVGNPFDSYLGKTSLQPLKMFIINGLVNASIEASFDKMCVSEIIDVTQNLGISKANTMEVIKDLLKQRYIFTYDFEELSETNYVIPTRLSGAIKNDLMGYFSFVETMMMDTFIGEDEKWKHLKGLTESIETERDVVRRLEKRVERVRIFYAYLFTLYKNLLDTPHIKSISSVWLSNPFEENIVRIDTDFEKALASARRNYG